MDITESNLWFYTLSTIAQTCAAILALGGTFVVFKLDKAKDGIRNYRGRVLGVLYVWRGASKTPDKFFDESDQDVFSQYRTIVRNNDEAIYDRKGLNEVYMGFENLRGIMLTHSGDLRLSNEVVLNHSERVRWCERMANLYSKNIFMEKMIVRLFLAALVLLSICIVSSITLLISRGHSFPVGIRTLTSIVILTAVTIVYSAISFWIIARSRPIE